MLKAKSVDSYISNAPKEIRKKLEEMRNIIRATAPKAEERISYGMPFYDYQGRLVYFAFNKNHIGLYIPPPTIAEHKKELKDYRTTKSAIPLHLDKKLPQSLIRKLIRAKMAHNEAKNKNN